MTKLYDVNRADLMSHDWCFACNKYCPLFGESVDAQLEVAGLPCADQSKQGSQQFEHGPTAIVYLAHGKRMVEKRTPLVVIENVQAQC